MPRSYFKIIHLMTFIICTSVQAQTVAQTHHPESFLNSIRGKPDEGIQIVNHFCMNCHAREPLVNLGAPRIGVADDWTFRLKQGVETMFVHTAEGYHSMPARGGCFECDDSQLRKAINALLPPKIANNKATKNK